MSRPSPRILFVPVTAPQGSGEYARALAIATAVVRRYPSASCHFALSEQSPVARDCPFPATYLPSSPTFHTRRVQAIIGELQPQIVVFDNAGRTAQLRAARRIGARVVFISSRPRQRRRAYRLRWLALIDEHWIAYPPFIAGPPTLLERCKARLMARPLARYLDCLLPAPDPDASLTPRGDAPAGSDHVLVLIGGVADHPDFAASPSTMVEAARQLALQGVPVRLVGAAPEHAPLRPPAALTVLPRLMVDAVAPAIERATIVVCNGGDTLIQVLALRR
ncbi:MAG: hypothetical protein RML32_10635, partial [Gammaproteobacteria bacterium]|nr:hypothetical protein [Gammaproteobacteria bacterium]